MTSLIHDAVRCRPRPRLYLTPADETALRTLALTRPKLSNDAIVEAFRTATGKAILRETAYRRVRALRKEGGWNAGSQSSPGDRTPPPTIDIEALPPGQSPPCGDCGTVRGVIVRGAHRPVRLAAERFGFATRLCSKCYKRHNMRSRKEREAKTLPACIDCGTHEGYRKTHRAIPERYDGKVFGIAGKLCHDCYQRHRHKCEADRNPESRRPRTPEEFEAILAEIRAEQGLPIGGVKDPEQARRERYAELARQERQRTIESRRATA